MILPQIVTMCTVTHQATGKDFVVSFQCEKEPRRKAMVRALPDHAIRVGPMWIRKSSESRMGDVRAVWYARCRGIGADDTRRGRKALGRIYIRKQHFEDTRLVP